MSPLPPAPYAVVLNAGAGRGLAGREWPRLARELRRRSLRYDLIRAPSGEEALAEVQALAPGVTVLAVGGDGTLGALLPALVGTGRPFAPIPLGSGNDFAGLLGLKSGDFMSALGRLERPLRAIDAIEVEVLEGDHAGLRRWLLNGLGTGLDAQVTQAYLKAPARLPGFWRYAWGAAASLRGLRLAELQVRIDGETLYQGPSALAAVMNGTRYGGGFQISPRSDVRDGLLNAVCSGRLNRFQIARLMVQVLRGKHLGQPGVHHGTGQEIELRWDRPTALHLDGDLYGQVRALRARVAPGAVLIRT